MKQQIILSGIGGQGVISAGEMMCEAIAKKGVNVTFVPVYGGEQRGGKTMCQIVISDKTSSPYLSFCDLLMVMDDRSLRDYLPMLKAGGRLIVNSDLVSEEITRDDIDIEYIPINSLAEEAGSGQAANMAALGTVMRYQDVIVPDDIKGLLKEKYTGKKAAFIPANEKALDLGFAQ